MYNDQQPNPGSWQEEEQRMTVILLFFCFILSMIKE